MNQQPDKLFRDKLESFSRPAPAGAWDRIDAGLDKKSYKGLWWKIAASLLLLIVAGYVLFFRSPSAPDNTISQHNTPAKQTQPVDSASIKQETPPPSVTPEKEEPLLAQQKAESVHKTTSTKQRKSTKQSGDSVSSPNIIQPKEQQPDVAQVSPEPATENITTVPAPETTTDTKSIAANNKNSVKGRTFVFRADETDDYLNKNVLADATNDEEKPSTFKKLLKKAQDLSNNQDPLGDLRQKKNEILALNFKNDKRGQNK